MYLINIISNSVKPELIDELLEHYIMNYDNNILIFLNKSFNYKFEKNEKYYKLVEKSDIRIFYEYVDSNIKNIENYKNLIYLELNEDQLEKILYVKKIFIELNMKKKDTQDYLQITGDFLDEEDHIIDFSDENIEKCKKSLLSTDIEYLKNITKQISDNLTDLHYELNSKVKVLQNMNKRYKIWFGKNKTIKKIPEFGIGFMIKTKIIKNKISNYKKVVELIQKNERDYEYIKDFTELFITGDSKANFYIIFPDPVNVEIPKLHTNEELLQKSILQNQIQQERIKLEQEEIERKKIEAEEIRIKKEQEMIKKETIKREKLKCLEFRTNVNCIKCMNKDITQEHPGKCYYCSEECKNLVETMKEKYLSES